MSFGSKCFRFILFSACLFCLCFSVYASEISEEEIADYLQQVEVSNDQILPADPVEDPELSEVVETDSQVVYTAENPLYVSVKTEEVSAVAPVDILADDGSDLDEYSVSPMALAPVTSDDTSGLKAVLLDILGPYEPVLFEYTYGSNYNTGREVFQDDVWLCSFWMLAIMVYSIFRLLGGWLLRKQ